MYCLSSLSPHMYVCIFPASSVSVSFLFISKHFAVVIIIVLNDYNIDAYNILSTISSVDELSLP